MKAIPIKPGDRFGRLIVRQRAAGVFNYVKWACECDCGNATFVSSNCLASGTTKSCGCLHDELVIARSTKHGMHGTPEYVSWTAMKTRCTNPKSTGYKYWGGKGVEIDHKWVESFQAFYDDMGPKPTPKHTLERNDGNGGYNKNNCRWATKLEQNNNASSNRLIEGLDGKIVTVAQAARDNFINEDTLRNRLNNGMSPKEALIKPVEILYPYDGLNLNLADWAIKLNLPKRTLYYRIHVYKWPLERALSTPLVETKQYVYNGLSLSLSEWANKLGIKLSTLQQRIHKLSWPIERALTKYGSIEPINKIES